MAEDEGAVAEILKALAFSALKHRDQRRKGPEASPYINHAIEVAEVLTRVGNVQSVVVLKAAILHDTIEDTETTPSELERRFGSEVARIVQEVTDDKTLPKEQRKRLQIERTPGLSADAKQIKLADKICNVSDVIHATPEGWSLQRRREYLEWTERVVAGCRGCNADLERYCDELLKTGLRLLADEA
jgi:guanosine-3',5'-bis(diphosphate) 3'-pyrophosphohydrolase